LPEHEEPRITSEQVLAVLQTCYDPCCKERGVSIVELGLIQSVEVAENGRDVPLNASSSATMVMVPVHPILRKCSTNLSVCISKL
jgi:metal-sulfur cluster biosynthetic enzyme